MSARETESFQVIIIGGGPVGAALAIDLGLRGITCALIERQTTLHRLPKGQNLTGRTLEHFWFWGVADEIRAARIMPADFPASGITAYGNLMSDWWAAPPYRETLRPYYYQPNDRLPQYQVEAVLRERLRHLPTVTTFFGWSAERIDQDDAGVRVTMVHREQGERRVLEGRYAVGCDGGHSVVREQLGIGRDGTRFDQLMVLAVFRSRELHRLLERFPPRSTYQVLRPELQGYWQFFGRIDVGEGWFFHAPVPEGTSREQFDVRPLLAQAAGAPFDCEIDHVGFWDLRVAIAEHYRVGRVFIAGDAAHTHPPYGGFGLNNGLEDARNLGWKLAATLAGWGGHRLLDSYEEERRPIFQDTAELFIEAGIAADRAFLAQHDPARDRAAFEEAWQARTTRLGGRALMYEPHYDGSPIVCGPPGARTGARGEHTLTARIGHHLPPWVMSGGRNAYEALAEAPGRAFALVTIDLDESATDGFKRAAQQLGMPLHIVRDITATAGQRPGARMLLVRPDQYVAWAGNSPPDDPRAVIEVLAGR